MNNGNIRNILKKLNEDDKDTNNQMIFMPDLLEKYIKETEKLKLSIKSIENRLDYLEEYIKHKFKDNIDNDISEKSYNSLENKSIDDIYKRILWIEQRLQSLEDKPNG